MAEQFCYGSLDCCGAPIAVHYGGGGRVAEGSEINGSEGDIQVTGAEGSPQLVPLFIKGGRGEGVAAAPHSALAMPAGQRRL